MSLFVASSASTISREYTRGKKTIVNTTYPELPTLFYNYEPVQVPQKGQNPKVGNGMIVALPADSGDSFSGIEDSNANAAYRLGKGGFGSVYLARNKIDKNLYAIKEFSEDTVELGHMEADILKEIGARFAQDEWMRRHILRPIEAYYTADQGSFVQVTDYVDGITLRERLKLKPALSIHEKLSICDDLLRIVNGLHEKGFAHRDIKPANVMLRSNSSLSNQVVLIDFGFACNKKDDMRVLAGTINYQSPELLSVGSGADSRGKIDWKAADAWACAATIYSVMHDDANAPFAAPRLPSNMAKMDKTRKRAVQKQCMRDTIHMKNHTANCGNSVANLYLDNVLIDDGIDPDTRPTVSEMHDAWKFVCDSFAQSSASKSNSKGKADAEAKPSSKAQAQMQMQPRVHILSRIDPLFDPSGVIRIASFSPAAENARVFLYDKSTLKNACPWDHDFKSLESIGHWIETMEEDQPLCKKCAKIKQ